MLLHQSSFYAMLLGKEKGCACANYARPAYDDMLWSMMHQALVRYRSWQAGTADWANSLDNHKKKELSE